MDIYRWLRWLNYYRLFFPVSPAERRIFRLLFPRRPRLRLWYVATLFGIAPAGANAWVAYQVFHYPKIWTESARDCEWTFVTMMAIAFVGFIGYFLHGFGQKKSLLFLIIQNALMVVVFAGIY